eukprot:m.13931 g.13931  ORF g.13931 m.13931 type:complete len:86 (-) comp6071_c0_seq1:4349-4606(-)
MVAQVSFSSVFLSACSCVGIKISPVYSFVFRALHVKVQEKREREGGGEKRLLFSGQRIHCTAQFQALHKADWETVLRLIMHSQHA